MIGAASGQIKTKHDALISNRAAAAAAAATTTAATAIASPRLTRDPPMASDVEDEDARITDGSPVELPEDVISSGSLRAPAL